MGLLETANLLDVVHEVAPVHILHHKVEAVLRKESKHQSQHPMEGPKWGAGSSCDL